MNDKPPYNCLRCGQTCYDASAYKRHLGRMNTCSPSLSDIDIEEVKKIFNERKVNIESFKRTCNIFVGSYIQQDQVFINMSKNAMQEWMVQKKYYID
jgi:hypothetical protein